ncbi:MAG: co-chaperone GroES [Dehalococcoides mccartyi]|jgi:Co-chaperonin GroES (HSP10)|uniref:Co-chaperonin GroES n=3 Tax=root TaxID=1 RepID=A0A0V8M2G1_9CHLR|nr:MULTISPECIES: co-chaperone GroES [Dehalococcoides]AAW39286.1 chaperonin GroES [Dehalococcoides mccartyi 195]AII59967.1 molecular chaperone GroES [Dehalococcoides mccartyi CG4]AQU03636.1 co-chaperone GroES [Dehalococcoides mccartyi]AQU04936.1 co-chaperone GroES [Dehalococcoides mccartyi]KSV17932.1 molecular chaperone GroES [Dehalococcoides mccartyi]
MATRFEPLHNMVLIQPQEKQDMSKGGIIIPDAAQEKSQEGVIVAVGPGRLDKDGKRELMSIKVGDKVLFPKFGGVELKSGGIDYIIMPESQIMAKIVG